MEMCQMTRRSKSKLFIQLVIYNIYYVHGFTVWVNGIPVAKDSSSLPVDKHVYFLDDSIHSTQQNESLLNRILW